MQELFVAAKELDHLPDLPNAGYSTTRERELSDAIMMFMRDVERDRLRLLNIVIEGRDKWRQIAGNIWNGLKVETDALDEIYFYFTLQAAPPVMQRELLDARQNPPKVRDIMRRLIPALETQRETLRLQKKWNVN